MIRSILKLHKFVNRSHSCVTMRHTYNGLHFVQSKLIFTGGFVAIFVGLNKKVCDSCAPNSALSTDERIKQLLKRVGIIFYCNVRKQCYNTMSCQNPIINLKDSYFEPAVGSPPNFARMCGYRPY